MVEPLHPDHTLVQAAVRREPSALEELTKRMVCIPRLVHHLNSRFTRLSPDDLPDVAQDAALVVLRRLADYHGRCPLDAWFHRVCLLTLRSYRRRRSRFSPLEAEREPFDPSHPAGEALTRERGQQLRAAIDAVGGAEAEVLRDRHLRGEDFETMAARTGIALATLRTRYYRGLKRLKEKLSRFHAREGQAP